MSSFMLQHAQSMEPLSLLVLHVASSRRTTKDRVRRSMDAIGIAGVAFGVVLFDGSREAEWDGVAKHARSIHVPFVVRAGRRPATAARVGGRLFFPKQTHAAPSSETLECMRDRQTRERTCSVCGGRAFVRRLQFWLQAVDLIAQHSFVWLADEGASKRRGLRPPSCFSEVHDGPFVYLLLCGPA